jgi:hypothetical protein
MIGEILREAAVLVAVFIPMDRIVSEGKTFTATWVGITIALSVALGAVGIVVEMFREGQEPQP